MRRLVMAGVLALAVAGCGDGDTAADPTTTVPPTTSAPTTPAAASGTNDLPPIVTADPDSGQPLIDHVRWTVNSAGSQLQIFPTPAGRTDPFVAAFERAWGEVVAAAPTANTPGMRDQFRCHWDWARIVAPNKPSWNLEPWRPDVGYDATVRALCNPGGPEGH